MIVSASRVFPIAQAPLDNSSLRLSEGVITALGPTDDIIRDFPGEARYDFEGCLMLPGLVNTHTHLEYTALRGLARPTDFLSWLQSLVRWSRLREKYWGSRHWEDSSRSGMAQALRSGITTVGDVVTFGGALHAAARGGIRMRAFLETVAVGEEECEAAVLGLEKELASSTFALPTLTPGISPHSIYTLSPVVLSTLAQLAGQRELPLSLHAAESVHETALLRGRGPLAAQIERWRLPFGPGYEGSLVHYLDDAAALSSRTLLIHGVGFNPEDLALIRRRGATVATCPRSNLLLGCGLPDYAAWKRAGVSFTYGTDSLASVPSFDLFAEARAVRAVLPESPETILRRLTLGGAEALGLGDITGSLEPGKAADIALIRLPGGLGAVGDIVTLASAGHVKATMVAGNFLYREPNSARYFPGRRERPAAPRGELRR